MVGPHLITLQSKWTWYITHRNVIISVTDNLSVVCLLCCGKQLKEVPCDHVVVIPCMVTCVLCGFDFHVIMYFWDICMKDVIC